MSAPGNILYFSTRFVAVTLVVATLLFSCNEDLATTDSIDLSTVPTQIIEDMVLDQTKAGKLSMRVCAPLMESYTRKIPPYDIFPQGMNIKAFTPEGLLETEITAKEARHLKGPSQDKWEAYGDVVINNYIKGETIQTDTIYWDRTAKKIFTHCYVQLKSPTMYMQGYGMESDDLARNAIILKPFDSFSIIKDSTEVLYIDTVNFVGPLLKPRI
jgi:LPS export ABC transporter protein LptC